MMRRIFLIAITVVLASFVLATSALTLANASEIPSFGALWEALWSGG